MEGGSQAQDHGQVNMPKYGTVSQVLLRLVVATSIFIEAPVPPSHHFHLEESACRKNALDLSVNVLSTKVLIGDTILTSPTGDGTAILRGHPSHAKV